MRLLMVVFLSLQLTSLVYASSKDVATKDAERIFVKGVSGVLKKNIKARLPAFKPECNAEKAVLERYQFTVRKKIKMAARALGYYHTKTAFTLKRSKDCWLLDVTVTPGEPVRVKALDIQVTGPGSKSSFFSGLILPYKVGDILNHLKYTDFKSNLMNIAQENGYLKADFRKKEILVDLKKNTAIVNLHFNTGPRVRYGMISVQQDVLGEDYVSRYILLKEGDYFSSEALIEQQQLLQNSGYYSAISVQAEFSKITQDRIPVRIILTSAKRDHYQLKLGYGTDTGLRSRVSLNRRWTGSSGKKLNVAVGLSQRINEITSTLVVPKENPEKNNLVYSVGIKQEKNDDVISESLKVGAVLTSLQVSDWKRTLSVSHLSDKTRVEGGSSTRSSLTLLGIQYAKVQAENLIFPRKGWRVRLSAEGAIDKLLSDASVLQLKAHGKYIHPLGKGRLLLRTDMGTTFGDSLDNLPKDLRFFAGGINSIRGYGYESLGEVNTAGKVIGGKNLVEFSAEYEHPVIDKWSVAGFVDAGNAFDDISTSEIKVGAGAGVRWRSPIGPVRFDIGVPESGIKDFRIHLSIGPDL